MKKKSFAEEHIIYGTEEQVVFPEDNGEEYAEGKGYGGAHRYIFRNCVGYSDGKTRFVQNDDFEQEVTQTIKFVHKAPNGTITPGLQSEQLLVCLIDRHLKLDEAFPSDENKEVISHLKSALEIFANRVKNREKSGVMGELKNHDSPETHIGKNNDDYIKEINTSIQVAKSFSADVSQVSDGYHTFQELYYFRNLFTVLLFNSGNIKESFKSRLHNDGTMYNGYFIVGGIVCGRQISFHMPEGYWDMLVCAKTVDIAPEWDGHTSHDVFMALYELANSK